MKRFASISFLVALAAAALSAVSPGQHPKPKLVLAIVIDQFRYDYLMRFRSDYHSGLDRLLDHGAVFTDAHYIQAATVTAVGHSTFLSGAPPSISGIVSNDWFDRGSGQTVTSVSDPKEKQVGGVSGAAGSSPRRLLVSTVTDEVKIRNPESHVIGVSIKDRSAILPSGHMADAAYWYDNASNHWVTSSFYRTELPAWAQAVNDQHPNQHYIGAEWRAVDSKDNAAAPFCTTVKGSAVRSCGIIEATPWGNEMIEEFAEKAIAGEDLGHHASTDILTVSFSSNDYVGHAAGPDDPEVRDMSIRTDRLLGKLLDYVDARVGADNTLVVLTADHGVAPVPEVNQARKLPGGRLSGARISQKITDALTKRFGPGNWILGGPAMMPYFNLKLISRLGLDPEKVERAAAAAAMTEPGIARVFTRHDILSGNLQHDPISDAVSLAFNAQRSGDLVILQEPYWVWDAAGTGHGTPYGYDTHVPVIFFGPGIKSGNYSEKIAVNDIAPTLSHLLDVEAPAGSIGRVLNEILQ
jgi:hypothetical protein